MEWSREHGLGCWQKRWQEDDEDDLFGIQNPAGKNWGMRERRNPGTLEVSDSPFLRWLPGGQGIQGRVLYLVLNSLTLGAFEATTSCCLDFTGQ